MESRLIGEMTGLRERAQQVGMQVPWRKDSLQKLLPGFVDEEKFSLGSGSSGAV